MPVVPARLTADVGRRRTARAPMRVPAPRLLPPVLYVSLPASEPRDAAVEEPARPGTGGR